MVHPLAAIRRAVRLAAPSNLDGPFGCMYGPARFEPGVFGIFRPVLLLPEGITESPLTGTATGSPGP